MLKREELKRRYGKRPWVSPYSKLIGMVDLSQGLVELHEFHARGTCIGGACWEICHYPRTSDLVVGARREGARNLFTVKIGRSKLRPIPGLAAAGIEAVSIDDDEIKVTYSGLGGAGVAITLCRGMAEGSKGVIIHELGGGGKLGRATLALPAMHKVTFGVDDTDTHEAGATWALVNEIGWKLGRRGSGNFLGHTIVQLYPANPYKTQNCVSIAATFAVPPNKEDRLVKNFLDLIRKYTLSEHTAVAVYKHIRTSDEIRKFAMMAKMTLLDISDARDVAKRQEVEIHEITGERGAIGALAAIGMADRPDEAVRLDVGF